MPYFRYAALDPMGNPTQNRLCADSTAQAREALQAQGYTRIFVQEEHKKRDVKVSDRELAVLAQQFAVIIRSDITLMEGLDTLVQQESNRHLKRALTQALADMQNGATFVDALGQHADVFPHYFLSMVYIGEVSGTLDQTFDKLATTYERDHQLKRKIRTSLTYPLVLSVLMLLVIGVLVASILPMFEQILLTMGTQLPPATQGILAVSHFLSQYGGWILLALLALGLGAYAYVHARTPKRSGGKWKLTFPVIGKVQKQLITARFCRSFALLLQSGAPVSTALAMVSDLMGNAYVSSLLANCQSHVEQGETLHAALAPLNLFPALFMRMVLMGETTGRLDDMLLNSAALFDEEANRSLERMVSSIEPVLVIALSLVIGAILLAVMLPMIDILFAI